MPFLIVIAEGIVYVELQNSLGCKGTLKVSSPMMCCPNAQNKEHLLSIIESFKFFFK